jgi:hypothetical protein
MPMHGSDSTLLRVNGFALSPYATRGLSQTLNPISSTADLRRTVNGDLRNFSDDVFQKFASTITGSDQRPPSIDGVWPGALVTVECAVELSFITASGAPTREMVDYASRQEGDLTYYRPLLDMMVISFDQSFDEYNAAWSWNIVMEEV